MPGLEGAPSSAPQEKQSQEKAPAVERAAGLDVESLDTPEKRREFGEQLQQALHAQSEAVRNDIAEGSRRLDRDSADLSREEVADIYPQAQAAFQQLETQAVQIDAQATAQIDSVIAEEQGGTVPEGASLRITRSEAELQALRDVELVGPEKYGKSLVKEHHRDNMTVGEHEQAQEKAMQAMQEKIDAGVIDPGSISSDMLRELGVEPGTEGAPDSFDSIIGSIRTELTKFRSEGYIPNLEEGVAIEKEIREYIDIYRESFPDAPPQKVFEVARDNARKLAYQTSRDKEVFSGSDHGTKHILDGNMKFANQMLDSLQKQGVDVSAKDKLFIHQIIIDHDIGYTVGAAQAKKGFEASKDHPLFSTKFVEQNEEYYKDKFGEDGYKMIRDGILYHSYPKTELNTPRSGPDAVNVDLVRSVTSIVDGLGVTAETKTPAFFQKPEAISTLMKLRLAMEAGATKDNPSLLDTYKADLREIADKEPNEKRRTQFGKAIDDFFNEYTAEVTLGHYTGVVQEVGVTMQGDKFVPHVKAKMSRIHALLGDMFGGKLEGQAFMKAMQEFGVESNEMNRFGLELEIARKNAIIREKPLQMRSETAVFEVDSRFIEETDNQYADIEAAISEVYGTSIRSEINSILDSFKKNPELARENVDEIRDRFIFSTTEKATADELKQIQTMIDGLANPDPAVAQGAGDQLRHFLTAEEKKLLKIQT
ncbi:MAG: hypothetical protein ABIG66_04250 [Candidatus Kerfeldbacteria bacterium]